MPPWSDRQQAFGTAVLMRDGGMPAGLVGPDGLPSPRRFAVYRNNVLAGLANGLGEAYPVVRRLVGEEFFRAMAVEFAAASPPRGPLMYDYGGGFAEFIDRFPPAAAVPYLADVARLERAWAEAYHAAEERSIDARTLQAIGAEEITAARLVLHGSLRVVVSDFPIVSIWQANMGEGEPGATALAQQGETALIARPSTEVELRRLAAGPAQFVLALANGCALGVAVERALTTDPRFDISSGLGDLFAMGLVAGVA